MSSLSEFWAFIIVVAAAGGAYIAVSSKIIEAIIRRLKGCRN
jgi:hypothetical protein